MLRPHFVLFKLLNHIRLVLKLPLFFYLSQLVLPLNIKNLESLDVINLLNCSSVIIKHLDRAPPLPHHSRHISNFHLSVWVLFDSGYLSRSCLKFAFLVWLILSQIFFTHVGEHHVDLHLLLKWLVIIGWRCLHSTAIQLALMLSTCEKAIWGLLWNLRNLTERRVEIIRPEHA